MKNTNKSSLRLIESKINLFQKQKLFKYSFHRIKNKEGVLMKLKLITKVLFSIALLSVLSFSVSADNHTNSDDFDATDSYLWLVDHCEEGDCGEDLSATAFYAVAMKRSGYGNTYGMQAIKFIQSERKDPESCFPVGSCNIKETAMAYWALSEYGEDTAGIEDYIRNELDVGLADNWWLEIITTAQDQYCTIGYPKDGVQEQVDVLVNEGTFPECNAGQPESFFDLNECIENNLVNSNPSLELTIDCSAIGQGTIISIVYNTGSSFYLTEQATTAKYQTQVQNSCHSKSGNCDKDTSLWANWVLNSRNSDIDTGLYLLTLHDSLKPIDTSLVYLTTSDANRKDTFLTELIDLQRLDGSFNKDNLETATAILALTASGSTDELNSAINYLESSVGSDGSWGGDELTTAMVLFSSFTGASIDLPPMSTAPSGSQAPPATCGDSYCDPQYEDTNSCPSDCGPIDSSGCVLNNKCEVDFGENSDNCQSDCYCGDNICDPAEQSGACELDCGVIESNPYPSEEYNTPLEVSSDGGFSWIIMIIIVILLILAVYFAYNHYFAKKLTSSKTYKNKPVFNPSVRGFNPSNPPPRAQPRSARPLSGSKSKAEMELERSLSEAKRLLGK